jgi:hypothetical protein
MVVIVFTILIQGILTPASERGSFTPSLLLFNGGFFQAIGVISFGKDLTWSPEFMTSVADLCSFRLPSQLAPDLRVSQDTYH